ncbi:MAG: putative ABC transporter ATP-binding protein [Gammaproteobacteria bacterium]|nr:putative ABC transporter ATP-binding protein [Gammaproteobacteria bacterium]
MTPYVVLEDLDKHYAEGTTHRQVVLSGVSAQIDRGSLVAIRGRSGSGKSTLLNLIAGLDIPDRGSIRVGGENLHAMTDRARTLFRRRHCGFVFQFFNLIPVLTVRENVMIGLELNAFDDDTASRKTRELLATVHLADRADSFPDQLSGGEQQRVALIRALAHEPRLLLADEPTGNLDATTELEILDLIRRLPGERNTTVIIATHSELVAGHADRVLLLGSGKLTGS